MALAGPTLLGTPLASTSNVASYATASASPTAGALIVVGVWNSDGSNAIRPTLSSAFSVVGGTWTDHGSAQSSTAVTRITLFSAVATGTPGSGAITADFGGDSQTGCIILAAEYTGQDASAPLIQPTITGHSGAGVTSRTMTLANPLGAATNQMLSFIGHNVNEAQAAAGGATELASSDIGYNTPTNRMAVYHETNDNSHSATWTTAGVANGASCEIVEAAGATDVDLTPATETMAAQVLSFIKTIFKNLTPATATEAAQALSVTKTIFKTLTPAAETSAAQAVTFSQDATQEIDIVAGVETSAAQALSITKTIFKTLTPAVDTSSAQALTFTKTIRKTLTPAAQTDAAQALSITKTIFKTLGVTVETDAAQVLAYTQAGTYSIVPALTSEAAQALSISHDIGVTLTPAQQAEVAQQLSVTKTIFKTLGAAFQTDEAQALVYVGGASLVIVFFDSPSPTGGLDTGTPGGGHFDQPTPNQVPF